MKTERITKLIISSLIVLMSSSCGKKYIMYDQSTGRYVEGAKAKDIYEQEKKLIEAQSDSRDREYERNKDRRESSRYVTRESILFGQSVDEYDVLAARERALQAEADVARVQAENTEAVSRAHSIIDYEKRYERAVGKLDKLEVLPGIRKE
jgi:alpha-beta hydrolase superfamily lysophospholipase